jgi:hypothetical protein
MLFVFRQRGVVLPYILMLHHSRLDGNFDGGIWSKGIAFTSVPFRIPVPNAPADLVEEIEPPFVSQVSKIADQIGNGIVVTCAATSLKHLDGLGGRHDVVG